MNRTSTTNAMARTASQGHAMPNQAHINNGHPDQMQFAIMRPRSSNSISSRRPKSRGSTASVHSGSTQVNGDPSGQEYTQYMAQQHQQQQAQLFNQNPEDMIMRFNNQMGHPGQIIDHGMHSLAHAQQQHNLPVAHYNPYEGIENQIPDHMLDDADASENGPRRKKGSNASQANENELRSILRQYEHCTLKQMAAEVQKQEGGNGKSSEKVKQVFAMLWLRESCKKNATGSVRRDRVFNSYAEKCGDEKVPTLNPASFGKLVRVIFPGVQTRRLGVRGESKYHYVELSLIDDKQPKIASLANRSQLREKSEDSFARRSISISQPPTDTANFPSPTRPTSRVEELQSPSKCPCQPPTRLVYKDKTSNPSNLKGHIEKLIKKMLKFPVPGAAHPVDNEPLELPDITPYLPVNTDQHVAEGLRALYRSHCTSVIDSLRFCKERTFFQHFTAFHGTLTVPVQRLFSHPDLATWILECDWLMYQKMIAFIAPLTTQVVPQAVLDTFKSISNRLTKHVAETFRLQAAQVRLARLVPAHIFSHLLARMLDVNQAANAAAAWLCNPVNRDQMWLDYITMFDPSDAIAALAIPMCSDRCARQMLKHEVRLLLSPLSSNITPPAGSFFAKSSDPVDSTSILKPVPSVSDDDPNVSFLDRWISFIKSLPANYPGHEAGAIVNLTNDMWDSILHRLTLGGAVSFSSWWMTKVFFAEMARWQVELGGFMSHKASELADLDFEELTQVMIGDETGRRAVPAKQVLASVSSATQIPNSDSHGSSLITKMEASRGPNEDHNSAREESKDLTAEIEQIKPGSFDRIPSTSAGFEALPSITAHQRNAMTSSHDDSAIDLDEDAVMMVVGKYDTDFRMTASDPADAEGDVVVV